MSSSYMTTARAGGTRLDLDAYQTPARVTQGLVQSLAWLNRPLQGPILEPAAGCGLLAKELRRYEYKVHTSDITRGRDFLKRTKPWHGDLVTNPPYRDRLDEKFFWKAMELVKGKICLLLQTTRLHGQRRFKELWFEVPPELVLVVPWRILFLQADGKTPISGQVYDHSWFVWDTRKVITRGDTRIDWLKESY